MKQRAEFLKGASNVYRTPHYIVRQRLGLLYNDEEANQLISRDTYYRCGFCKVKVATFRHTIARNTVSHKRTALRFFN